MATLDKAGRIRALNRAKNLGPIIPAGWSKDPATGVAVWLPSWFRRGTYQLKLEVPASDGLAHGKGRAILTASLPGNSDRTFEGVFHRGYFVGTGVSKYWYEMLPTDSYLVRLPDSPAERYRDVSFWLINEFGVRIAVNACAIPTNRRPELITLVPERLSL